MIKIRELFVQIHNAGYNARYSFALKLRFIRVEILFESLGVNIKQNCAVVQRLPALPCLHIPQVQLIGRSRDLNPSYIYLFLFVCQVISSGSLDIDPECLKCLNEYGLIN